MAAAGTKKLLIALLILINILVLLNIRRSGPALPRALGQNSWRLRSGDRRDPQAPALSASAVDVSRPADARGGGGGVTGSGVEGEPAADANVAVVFPPLGQPTGNVARNSGVPREGKAENGGGREGAEGEGAVLTATGLSRREAEEKECKEMLTKLNIVPNRSWGRATKAEQQRWDLLGCNSVVSEGRARGRPGPIDCTERPSKPSDPLVAICAGSTTRGVPYPSEDSLALFRFLLPSLERTAECGFNYIVVIGYDVGDEFFDTESGKERTLSWFDAEISKPAASRGISVQLELVRVANGIRKPGPVFTAVTRVAYELGANYIYRVNDDSEMVDPWTRVFVDTLEAMGPPYGVVGPESMNMHILVHDFTHRLHMDIFERQYYPASLTDWYVDDWISRVYGNSRTARASNVHVEHHTGAHGQRYKADTSKARTINGLVTAGAKKIVDWCEANGHEEAARQMAGSRLDGQSAKKINARNVP